VATAYVVGLALITAGAVALAATSGGIDGAYVATSMESGEGLRLEGREALANRSGPPTDVAARADADVETGLTSRLASRRVQALRQVVEQGGDAAALRPEVERLATDADPRTALWARAALVRLGGPGGMRAEVCRTALVNPGWEDAEQALGAVAPDVAQALLAAGAEQRHRARQGPPLAGLDTVVETWTQSSHPDPEELVRALSSTTGDDLLAWLRIARGLVPMPPAALNALARRLADATPQDAAGIAKFFSAGPHLSLADEGVERALLARAAASEAGHAGPWLLALGRLPRLSAETRRSLDALAKRSPEDAQDVAVALRAGG